VYMHDGSLFGLRFNSQRREVAGAPVLLAENVPVSGGGQFDVSSAGTLVYPVVPPPPVRRLVWVDRRGAEQPIAARPGSYLDPRLSPDNKRLAVSSSADIWIWTFATSALKRLTFTPGPEYNPAWMPDSRRVLFDSNEGAGTRTLRRAVDGTGPTDVVMPTPGYPETVTPDGRFLLYHTATQLPGAMFVPVDGSAPARPLAPTKTPTRTFNAEISPNGRWVAYQSDESGSFEIYVRPFPALDAGLWQISPSGGSHPVWAQSGRELFFINGGGTLVSVPTQIAPDFTYETPGELFRADQYYVEVVRDYDVSADASRFIFVKNLTGEERPALIVVSHWLEEVRVKMERK
jgi:hypothetical protein